MVSHGLATIVASLMPVFEIALLIVLGWLVASIACVGLGFGLLALSERERRADGAPFIEAFWSGFVSIQILLIIYNFWAPVNMVTLVCILLLAALGWALWIRKHGLVFCLPSGVTRREVLALVAIVIVLAMQACGTAEHSYDTGLYHLQAVKWAHEHPVVPGLANLHARLGFNNSSFLYTALWWNGPFADRVTQVANGLLILWTTVPVVLSAVRLADRRKRPEPIDLYWAIVGFPLATMIFNGSISALGTEVPVTCCAFVAGGQLLQLLANRSGIREGSVILLALLSAGIVLSRITAAVFAAGIWLAYVLYACRGDVHDWDSRRLRRMIAIPAVAIGLWCVRGIILSGYPLFPAGISGLDVDWRVPVERLEYERFRTRAYAIAGSAYLDDPAWHQSAMTRVWMPSIMGDMSNVVMPLGLFGLSLLGAIRRWRHQEFETRRRHILKVFYVFALIALAVIIVWVCTAPAPRFMGYALWVLAAAVGSAVLGALKASAIRRGCLMWCAVLAVWLARPGSEYRILPDIESVKEVYPHVEHVPYVTRGGAVVNVSQKSQNMRLIELDGGASYYMMQGSELMWNAPLPSTPEAGVWLQMRDPQDLRAGFRTATPVVRKSRAIEGKER